MTKSDQHDSDLVQQVTDAVMTAQAAGVQVLEAEMKALAMMMPGAAPAGDLPSDAEVEAGFDNMPV